MNKLKVIDKKGEKTFESMSAIKRWYQDIGNHQNIFFKARDIPVGVIKLKLFLSYIFVNDKVYKISAKFYTSKDSEYIGTATKAAAYTNKIYGEKYPQTAADFNNRITDTVNMIQAAKNRELFIMKVASFKKDFEALMKKYNFIMEGEIWGEDNDYADLNIIDAEYNEKTEFINIKGEKASIAK